jgi:hypothetical protein
LQQRDPTMISVHTAATLRLQFPRFNYCNNVFQQCHRLNCCNNVLQQWPRSTLLRHCAYNVLGSITATVCSNNALGPHCCKQDAGSTGVSKARERKHVRQAQGSEPQRARILGKARLEELRVCQPVHTSHLIYLGSILISSQAPSKLSLQIFGLEF